MGFHPSNTAPSLGGVASLGPPRPGNPGNRGMEAALGLRAPPTALQGLRLIVLSRVRLWLRPSPGGGYHMGDQLGCTVCVHNTAELVSSSWVCTVCTLYRMYNVYTVWQCVHCTLYNVYIANPNWFLRLDQAKAYTFVFVLD